MAYQFPYTNLHDLDLDWLLNQVKSVVESNNKLISDLNDDPPGELFSQIVDDVTNAIKDDTDPESIYGQMVEATRAANTAAGRATTAAETAENLSGLIAPTYSASSTYYKGEYVAYNGHLYRALTKTTGTFNASDWEQVTSGGVLELLTNLLYAIIGTTNNYVQINLIKQPFTRNGLTVTWDYKGTLMVTGTPATNAAFVQIGAFDIPAGTYMFAGNPSTKRIQYQVYYYDNDTLGSKIKQGYEGSTFTIPDPHKVYFRIIVENGTSLTFDNETVDACLIKIEDGETATFIPHYTATDYVARQNIQNTLAEILGLDVRTTALESNATLQYTTGNITDVNEFTNNGVYSLPYNRSNMTNLPHTNSGRGVILVSKVGTNNPYISQIFINNGAIYIRVYASGTWTNWILCAETNANTPREDTEVIADYYSRYQSISPTLANAGTHLTIMSYNTANYNHDVRTRSLSDAELINLKKLLFETQPDFIGLEENNEYIDVNDTMKSQNYIFNPIYPFPLGIGGPVIESKIHHMAQDPENPETMSSIVRYTNGRYLRFAVYDINNVKLLFVVTHPISAAENTQNTDAVNIAARLVQYTEMFNFINGSITLYNTADIPVAITCPSHDACIICMDSNAVTDEDRANLLTLANTNNFTCANGGYIGWINTMQNQSLNYAIDNILVSDTVIINSIKVYSDWSDRLSFSDHLPIVCDVTVTPAT